ncbi:conjugative transposon protein TraN [uncultured Alistipes sp.]|uniref:conjugative transposon protein TraN n=1 Tax=uncultured Alistipes sp. TaxID=538949 RepID=UPI00349F59F2
MSRVMRQETFTILFLMRKGRPKKNGLASVYARITTGSLRQEFYFHCEGKPELWNQKKERMMGTSRLAQKVNEMLDEFRVQILDIRSKLLAEGYAANAAQIKQRYLNPTCNTMMLIAGLTDYAKRRQAEVGVRITQRTADKYERLLRYLKQYLAQRGKAEDIPIERMNYEFLDGFNLFLQTAHRCRHNGAVAVMDCLRNFVLYCLRNEWITKNPFRYYKLKEDEVQAKEHLTAHELELLSRKALDHRLARIRDVFVFCCLTGLAFADADHLRREHLSQDDEGRVLLREVGREKPATIKRMLSDIYRQNRTDVKGIRTKKYGIGVEVLGIYVSNDVVYIHTCMYNDTNISFEVDAWRFIVADRKLAKRTAQQQTMLEILRVCNDQAVVRGHQRQRTVFALPKLTISDDKVLLLEIIEKNGARHQTVEIPAGELLDAKML